MFVTENQACHCSASCLKIKGGQMGQSVAVSGGTGCFLVALKRSLSASSQIDLSKLSSRCKWEGDKLFVSHFSAANK